jgi:hypothetical protein
MHDQQELHVVSSDVQRMVGRRAKRLGFHAVSAGERLLMPVGPDWSNDAGLPESHLWDSLEMLTWAVEHVAAMRACWGPDPVEYHGEHYRIPLSTVGPKPWANTIPLFFGALTRRTIERAARIGDGFITVALDWDITRNHIRWYRDAGGTGTVMVNSIQAYPDGPISPTVFTDAVLNDLDRTAAVGADEMHITLNLTPVHPDQQVELLEALAAQLDLAVPSGRR